MSTPDVLAEVGIERERQDAKFGQQNHHPSRWLDILMEEVGEAAEVSAQCGLGDPDPKGFTWADYRKEMIQVAAVAVSMVESFDRNGPPPTPSSVDELLGELADFAKTSGSYSGRLFAQAYRMIEALR